MSPPMFGQMTKAEMLAIVKEQALSKQKKKETPARTVKEQIKFYATFTFSLIAISGFSVLMFLVPFIVDPALATLTADFVEKPVECRVILSRQILGETDQYYQISLNSHCFDRSNIISDPLWHVSLLNCKYYTDTQHPIMYSWILVLSWDITLVSLSEFNCQPQSLTFFQLWSLLVELAL